MRAGVVRKRSEKSRKTCILCGVLEYHGTNELYGGM